MMKKILACVFVFVGLFFFSQQITPPFALAQGTCSCKSGPTGSCLLDQNNCDMSQGFFPRCYPNQCSANTTSCICTTDQDGTPPPPPGGFDTPSPTTTPPGGNTPPPGGTPFVLPTYKPLPIYCAGQLSLDTAIGCIPIGDMNSLVAFIFRWALGIGGGIAFILIIFSGFIILTSTGNPDRIKAGQELLSSA